jgi:hypothetical protein
VVTVLTMVFLGLAVCAPTRVGGIRRAVAIGAAAHGFGQERKDRTDGWK